MRFIVVVCSNEAGKDGGVNANAARHLRHAACVVSSEWFAAMPLCASQRENKRWRNFFSGNTLVS
jgi:hypothetical protein